MKDAKSLRCKGAGGDKRGAREREEKGGCVRKKRKEFETLTAVWRCLTTHTHTHRQTTDVIIPKQHTPDPWKPVWYVCLAELWGLMVKVQC